MTGISEQHPLERLLTESEQTRKQIIAKSNENRAMLKQTQITAKQLQKQQYKDAAVSRFFASIREIARTHLVLHRTLSHEELTVLLPWAIRKQRTQLCKGVAWTLAMPLTVCTLGALLWLPAGVVLASLLAIWEIFGFWTARFRDGKYFRGEWFVGGRGPMAHFFREWIWKPWFFLTRRNFELYTRDADEENLNTEDEKKFREIIFP